MSERNRVSRLGEWRVKQMEGDLYEIRLQVRDQAGASHWSDWLRQASSLARSGSPQLRRIFFSPLPSKAGCGPARRSQHRSLVMKPTG